MRSQAEDFVEHLALCREHDDRNIGIVPDFAADLSKEQIYNSVWKEPYFGDYNIVMSHIRNIREKMEDNPSKPVYIQTVWEVGYRFNQTLQIRETL